MQTKQSTLRFTQHRAPSLQTTKKLFLILVTKLALVGIASASVTHWATCTSTPQTQITNYQVKD